jgi:hypothetical protein
MSFKNFTNNLLKATTKYLIGIIFIPLVVTIAFAYYYHAQPNNLQQVVEISHSSPEYSIFNSFICLIDGETSLIGEYCNIFQLILSFPNLISIWLVLIAYVSIGLILVPLFALFHIPVLYKKTESKSEITIIYKTFPIYYLMIILIVLSSMIPQLYFLFVPLLITLIFLYLGNSRVINREIKQAIKNGKVTVSGSRFSFKNPLTYKIKK